MEPDNNHTGKSTTERQRKELLLGKGPVRDLTLAQMKCCDNDLFN